MGEELKIIITADDKASAKVGGLNKALGGLGSLASGALKVGLGVAVGGVAALGAGLVSSTLSAMDAQNVQADLQAVLKSTGGAAGVTADMANELAGSLQNVTRFEDDTILSGEAMLLTFTNIGKDVFPMATEAMLNMAQKFGSVDAASVQLGKALNDPISGVTALRKVGVMLTDQQEEQIKQFMAVGDQASAQKIILQELEVEFGGLARAAGETFAGKLDILKNKFGDIQEQIGGAMLPGLTLLGDKLIEVLNKPEVQAAITALSNWLAEELPKAIDAGMGFLNTLQKDGLSGVLKQAQTWARDPATTVMLENVGRQVGEGVVSGIQFAATNAPAWAAMGVEIGKVATPILANTGLAIGYGFWASIFEKLIPGFKSKEFTSPFKIPGFASGGVVPGSAGSPMLAMVHGGETITPAGGGGGGGGGLTFVYAPTFSLADAREVETKLRPMLDQWYQGARRRRV